MSACPIAHLNPVLDDSIYRPHIHKSIQFSKPSNIAYIIQLILLAQVVIVLEASPPYYIKFVYSFANNKSSSIVYKYSTTYGTYFG